MLSRDDDSVLRVALILEVDVMKKRRRPKKIWNKQVEKKIQKIGLKEDALKVEKWSANNCRKNGVNPVISAKGTIPEKV